MGPGLVKAFLLPMETIKMRHLPCPARGLAVRVHSRGKMCLVKNCNGCWMIMLDGFMIIMMSKENRPIYAGPNYLGQTFASKT